MLTTHKSLSLSVPKSGVIVALPIEGLTKPLPLQYRAGRPCLVTATLGRKSTWHLLYPKARSTKHATIRGLMSQQSDIRESNPSSTCCASSRSIIGLSAIDDGEQIVDDRRRSRRPK